MTTTEQSQPHVVQVEDINAATFQKYISINPGNTELLSFQDWAAREQVRLLRAINSKLNFFVILIILGIILSFFQSLGR